MSEEDVLLQAILGLFDHATVRMVKTVNNRSISTYATRFPASSVYELVDAVEAVRPGLFREYLKERERLAREADEA